MMVYLCVALILLGCICLTVEVFIPGFGVFGLGGIACLIISGVLAVLYVPFGWVMVTVEIVLLAGLFYFLYKYIKKKQLYGNLVMNEALKEVTPELNNLDEFVGKTGTAMTALRPAGEIEIGGVRLEAASDGSFVNRNGKVKVIGVQNNRLIVREEENYANSN